MDTLMDIIRRRKSIRRYQNRPLTKDMVNSILEAARHAPSARNLQPLEYKVITNRELMLKLSDGIARAMQAEGIPMKAPPAGRPDFFYGAPLLIIVTAPKDNPFAVSDAALAVQNVMLYATSIGLGSCFIGMAKLIERDKDLLKLLHIPDTMNIVAAVICGYPDEDPPPKEKRLKAEFFE
ncbi:MAG: nitroreductase family protein [Dehalococcoidales bacterium]|nr:nitroreductase family protein [Dehalococcoidales bacterium]